MDYSIPIPKEYWKPCEHQGTLVQDRFNGKDLVAYLPYGYTKEKEYPIFYFKMGMNNSAMQFWTFLPYTNHFEYVIDNLIERGEVHPCVIVSIQGNAGGEKGWLQENAYALICYVEGKVRTYAKGDASKIIESAPYRAVGGWSMGSIETRTMLVDDLKNGFWKMFGYYDIQSGYNSKKMNTISDIPLVRCVCGSNDDPNCVKFTKDCEKFFKCTKNIAQIVKGYTHSIQYQVAYFYNAIQDFEGIPK
jgi:hypothetical protein